MVAFRRRRDNFALEHAVDLARRLGKPLVVLEALRVGYEWASGRLHRFVLEGMADNARDFSSAAVTYYPYVELEDDDGSGLLEALAARACVVVSDDYPCFFVPRMQEAAAARLNARLELVDGNGLLPLRATDRLFLRAFDFRRFVQRELASHLARPPAADPLKNLKLPAAKVPRDVTARWPMASPALLSGEAAALRRLPIDHGVCPVALRGGSRAALTRAKRFVDDELTRYREERDHPDERATSGLSPYLHFGHIGAHSIFSLIAKKEEWSLEHAGQRRRGERSGFWQMHPSAEAFLDQLVVWRELGFNFCAKRSDYDSYDSLPDWAKKTLAKHERDTRPALYDLARLEAATTGDELWNAAQRELVRTGGMHNYLRMLWGKKVLEWSRSPEEALGTLVHLNNKYALDGRDPNAYSGIFWCFGRYDRPWGPERAIFGTVRYMSSENTRRKLHVKQYLERFGR